MQKPIYCLNNADYYKNTWFLNWFWKWGLGYHLPLTSSVQGSCQKYGECNSSVWIGPQLTHADVELPCGRQTVLVSDTCSEGFVSEIVEDFFFFFRCCLFTQQPWQSLAYFSRKWDMMWWRYLIRQMQKSAPFVKYDNLQSKKCFFYSLIYFFGNRGNC